MLSVKCWNTARKTNPYSPAFTYTRLLELFLLHLPRLQHKRPQKTPLNLQCIRHILGMLTILNKFPKPQNIRMAIFLRPIILTTDLMAALYFKPTAEQEKTVWTKNLKQPGPRTWNSLSSLSCVTNHSHDANTKPYRLMPSLRITCSRKPEHRHGKCSSESHFVGQTGFPQKNRTPNLAN